MNNNYDLNNENKISDEGNNNFIGSVNNDFASNQNNNLSNLDNYNQTLQNNLVSNGNSVINQESNVNSDSVYNQNNDIQMPQNSLSNDYNSENMVYSSSTINNDMNLKIGKKKSKAGFIVAMIVIVAVLVSLGAKILIPIVTTKKVISTISTAKLNSIIDKYKMIEKNVKMFIYVEQPVTCNSDCSKLYDYDENYFDIKVTDKDTYYQIELKAIGERYKGANLDSDKCQDLSNATCNGNKITGKVYKISE